MDSGESMRTSLQKTVPLLKGLNFTYLENVKSQTSVSHRIMSVSLICPLLFEIFLSRQKRIETQLI